MTKKKKAKKVTQTTLITSFVPQGVRLNGTISVKAKQALVAASKKTKVPQSVIVNNAILAALTPRAV